MTPVTIWPVVKWIPSAGFAVAVALAAGVGVAVISGVPAGHRQGQATVSPWWMCSCAVKAAHERADHRSTEGGDTQRSSFELSSGCLVEARIRSSGSRFFRTLAGD